MCGLSDTQKKRRTVDGMENRDRQANGPRRISAIVCSTTRKPGPTSPILMEGGAVDAEHFIAYILLRPTQGGNGRLGDEGQV